MYILVERTPPPRGGGGFYLLCSLIKNSEEEDPPRSTWYKFFDGGPLPPGSCLRNIVNRKSPRGGGGGSIYTHVCAWRSIHTWFRVSVSVSMYMTFVHDGIYVHIYVSMYPILSHQIHARFFWLNMYMNNLCTEGSEYEDYMSYSCTYSIKNKRGEGDWCADVENSWRICT